MRLSAEPIASQPCRNKRWIFICKERRQLTTIQITHIFHKSCVGSMVSSQPPLEFCCRWSIWVLVARKNFSQLDRRGQRVFFTIFKKIIYKKQVSILRCEKQKKNKGKKWETFTYPASHALEFLIPAFLVEIFLWCIPDQNLHWHSSMVSLALKGWLKYHRA